MDEGLSIEDFRRWKVVELRDFLRRRGLKHSSKRKDELVALVFAAYQEKRPEIVSGNEAKRLKAGDYQQLLFTRDSHDHFTDPNLLDDGWESEQTGMVKWPPTMQMDIADYLLTHVEDRDLSKRLMGDYKEGKAYSYFDSKWLKEVWYHNVSSQSTVCFLKSESTPSARINEIPHKIWVAIDKKSGKVESAYCTCFAGLGSTCNHVAAVLFKLEFAWQQGWTNLSCTSRPCEWIQYGASKKVLEPKEIDELDWRNPHHRKKGSKKMINPAKRMLFTPARKSSSQPAPSLDRIIANLYSSCPLACAFQYATLNTETHYLPEEDFNVGDIIEISTSAIIPPCLGSLAQTSSSVVDFLDELPKLTPEEIVALEMETRLQSDSSEWLLQRQGRITGSIAHRVMTRMKTIQSDPEKQHDIRPLLREIMGYSSPPENLPALKYGRSMEDEARREYKETSVASGHANVSVALSGLYVHAQKIYIGATPDGFVSCDCCGSYLLEIKCPLSIAHEDPKNVSLTYLECSDGKYSLKQSHPYYSQVQFQLGVTEKKWCDFFVYTRFGHLTVRVPFDEKRWGELQSGADYFFQNFVAHELVCRSLQKEMQSDNVQETEEENSGAVLGSKTSPELSSTICSTPSLRQVESRAGDSDMPSSLSLKPPSKRPAERTRGKKKGKRTKHSFSPLYSCGVCADVCKEASDMSGEADNSVQCDNEDCGLWFHWSCVGYSESMQNWLCPTCSA